MTWDADITGSTHDVIQAIRSHVAEHPDGMTAAQVADSLDTLTNAVSIVDGSRKEAERKIQCFPDMPD
jgi:hypothetical protein